MANAGKHSKRKCFREDQSTPFDNDYEGKEIVETGFTLKLTFDSIYRIH